MNEYPQQPRSRNGWPDQPPRYSGAADGRSRPGQSGYAQGTFGQGGYEQGSYPPSAFTQDGYAGAGYESDLSSRNGYQRRGPVQPAPRRRRRRKGWIVLLSILAVLAVLLVVGDQVAKSYAQNMIAGKLQSDDNLPAKPSVTIEGFPFLTQLAAHDIGTINISASNVPAGRLDITTVNATATGVHISSGFNGATIDKINGTALITFNSLVNAAGAQGGVTLTADPKDGPNAANVSVGPFNVVARITQTGPSQITVKISNLPSFATAFIGTLPDYVINVPKLPAGLQMQSVSVTSQGVSVAVAAQHTTLSQ